MRILVTGGAGYIGSFMAQRLLERGDEVDIIDSMEVGNKELVPAGAKLHVGNLLDKEFVLNFFKKNKIDAVIHFAAYALAGESMTNPEKYFENNIQGGLNILDSMKSAVPYFIFSSTCAIYGTPTKIPVTEDESKKPESAYGESKLTFEKVLEWYDQIFGIKNVRLRYFNAAGASLDGLRGEKHKVETHIIPIAIKAALNGEEFPLYGTDYPTPDGTCIRDYIHVLDLVEAHLLALDYLRKENRSDYFNLGTGKGYSNLEILNTIEKVGGTKIKIKKMPRRSGDPSIIYADNTKAKKLLGFKPQYSDIEKIIKTAWDWHEKNR